MNNRITESNFGDYRLKIEKYAHLSNEIKTYLGRINHQEFGHFQIVKQITWSIPDWVIFVLHGADICAYCNIVERTILVDTKPYLVAGINNVVTLHNYRNRGLASYALKETQQFMFNELNVKLGLLLCAPSLISFYEKLNWYVVRCPVHFAQPKGRQMWTATTMLLTPDNMMSPAEIDLNGLPW